LLKIAIIGGGAAGLMAAIRAGEEAISITLFEKNPFCGKKIGITGKGRCNVTNSASVREMEEKIPRGAKFLRTALYAFPPSDTIDFFESCGVPLKTERGGRIFPVSDRAKDIVNALCKKALANPNLSLKKEEVLSISKAENGFLIQTKSGHFEFDRVLVATGGKSYPLTGSTGAGYRFAEDLGHKIEPPKPALCPLLAKEAFCKEAMGLSLKNCALEIFAPSGKKVYEDFSEMLFCHFGVSGPMILSTSSYLDFEKEPFYRAFLDLKPALSPEGLDKRVLSDFAKFQNRDLVNSLSELLPQKLILPVISSAKLDPRKKVNLVSKEERLRLVETLKKFPLTLVGTRPIEEAIITRGGVSLSEIDPRTMGSRLHRGLYFAGEVIDADALTGGFNLQIAFSTGHLAGRSISQEAL
jgi:predicted Rossmann fold flavoprotein